MRSVLSPAKADFGDSLKPSRKKTVPICRSFLQLR